MHITIDSVLRVTENCLVDLLESSGCLKNINWRMKMFHSNQVWRFVSCGHRVARSAHFPVVRTFSSAILILGVWKNFLISTNSHKNLISTNSFENFSKIALPKVLIWIRAQSVSYFLRYSISRNLKIFVQPFYTL